MCHKALARTGDPVAFNAGPLTAHLLWQVTPNAQPSSACLSMLNTDVSRRDHLTSCDVQTAEQLHPGTSQAAQHMGQACCHLSLVTLSTSTNFPQHAHSTRMFVWGWSS